MLIFNGNDDDIFASVFDLYRPGGPNGAPIFEDALINPGDSRPAAPFQKDQDGNYSVRWIARSRTDNRQSTSDQLYPSGSEDNITISF